MTIRRLECPECGVGVDGAFDAGPLARLGAEHLAFVEAFLRARGKIKDVEEDLGISYPTVIARLNDVLAALGFEQRDEPQEAERRRRVLDDLAAGRITAAEATQALRALGE
jgi:hypothetical protein